MTPGAVVELSAGVGPLAVRAPCRVVEVVRASDVAAFAYGTLPGHPESGEESFVVRLEDDGRVTFTVRAFAVEATLPARAPAPRRAEVHPRRAEPGHLVLNRPGRTHSKTLREGRRWT